jgi:hypothetical protein
VEVFMGAIEKEIKRNRSVEKPAYLVKLKQGILP